MTKHRTSNIERRTSNLDARGVRSTLDVPLPAAKSGAEATAVQTLRECRTVSVRAKRLDCGAFTAAFPPPNTARNSGNSRITSGGFTLIEVLLAVGIFAIVLFAINTVFFSALKLERATSRAVDARAPLNQAFAMLRQDLQGAVQPMTNSTLLPRNFTTGGRSGGLGSSQAGSLEFYTTTGVTRDDAPWGDLQKVRYELVASADRATATGQNLVRVITRNVLATTTAEEDEQLLMSDVESVEFLCYNGADWRNTWDTSAGDVGLPQAVRVCVQLATENQTKLSRQPLELLVPISTVLLTNSFAGGVQ